MNQEGSMNNIIRITPALLRKPILVTTMCTRYAVTHRPMDQCPCRAHSLLQERVEHLK